MKKIKALRDESGHWYVLPIELDNEFYIDSENEDMIDSGEFDAKYGKYRTGGDINRVQLWADV